MPVEVRYWKRRREMRPYFRTDLLKPGQSWSDAPTVGGYTEHYVRLDGQTLPVGVAIARELLREGAIEAVCTDLTLGRLRLIDCNLICVEATTAISEILQTLHAANGNRWAGLPDAIGIFPDGRIALREAKVAKKDRLNKPQHEFARAARGVLGVRLDLAVVEWGYEVSD